MFIQVFKIYSWRELREIVLLFLRLLLNYCVGSFYFQVELSLDLMHPIFDTPLRSFCDGRKFVKDFIIAVNGFGRHCKETRLWWPTLCWGWAIFLYNNVPCR